ncbi:MAG: Csp1 family four helix bundle copper storage protein [bacterium]|nr:Csp1 family four helix bundle copper storage protein [bacterium]
MLSRKELIERMGVGAAVLMVGPLCSEPENEHEHGHGGPHEHSGSGLAGIAGDTASIGKECLSHCIDQLAKGDKTMTDCAHSVRDMITACTALSSFAAANSEYLKSYLPVCKKICADCREECLKHAKHHAICKSCADACERCLDAMKAA